MYYDGTKLLSMLDINGNKPEIYIITSNRTAGKTTYFSRYFLNRFFKYGEKFLLLYRYNNELDNISDRFYKDIQTLFFPDTVMTEKKRQKGAYIELFVDNVSCGYATAINCADKIKKLSHLLTDVQRIMFDEFQSETNTYCNNEIKKFISIHTSIARGNGKQTRYVPVFLISNPVSIINPYYLKLGISTRLNSKVKFLRGNGFILEQSFNESASNALKNSGFMKAFENDDYSSYAINSDYLNDNGNFVSNINGYFKYVCTLKYDGKEYAIKEYPESGLLYCDYSVDSTYPLKITVNSADMDINYIMLNNNSFLIANFRFYFSKGCFRFKDLNCKDVIIKILSIK